MSPRCYNKPGAGPAVRSSRVQVLGKETDSLIPVLSVARQASAEVHLDVGARAEAATQLALGPAQTVLDALSELDPDTTPVKEMLALNELVRATGGGITNGIKLMLNEDVDPRYKPSTHNLTRP